MRRSSTLLAAVAMTATLAFSGVMPARAVASTTHWVAVEGVDSGTGSSCSEPGYVGGNQESIKSALAAASEGDTIHICAGEYVFTDDGYNGSLPSGITIVGDGAGTTILDGDETYYLIAIDSTDDLTISNLTLTRGYDSYGGALTLEDTNAVISSVKFLDNSADGSGVDYGGAALYIYDSSTVTVVGSRFEGNESAGNSAGGAINIFTGALKESHVTIIGSDFIGNRAGQGPAIYTSDDDVHLGPVSTLTIRNSTFVENLNVSADDGGAISHEHTNANLTLLSNRFDGNSGAGYGGAAEIWNVTGKIVVERNTFRSNSATEGGALWIDVRSGTRQIARNQFVANVADYGGAVAFECETTMARRVSAAIARQNRFSRNRATEDRRSSNVFASNYGCD